MTRYKIHRGADGVIKGFGADDGMFQPPLDAGDIIEYSDTPPEFTIFVDSRSDAKAALDRSDLVALRCFKADIQFPPEWVAYCVALRVIVRTGEGPLPEQPEYPQGS